MGRRGLVLAAVAGLLGTALVLSLVDQRLRAGEDRSLEACGDRAYAAAVRADSVLGSMAEYIRPSIAERSGLWVLMSEAAERARPPVEEAFAVCREVQVRAVHRTHVRERAAYVDYLRARRDRLDAIVADGRASAESDPALARLREAAFGDRP